MALTNAALLKAISEDCALASAMLFPHQEVFCPIPIKS